MSLECSECEHDLRGGHDPACSRARSATGASALMSQPDTGSNPERPVEDLAEAIAHLRNVAEIPGRLIRTGSAAKLVLERLRSEADIEAEVIARQAQLKGLTVEEGAQLLELDSPRELMIAWVHGAREWLGEAPNYVETRVDFPKGKVEMEVKAAGEFERYVFTLQRAGKLTPHEAREQAEAELHAARERIAALEEEKRQLIVGFQAVNEALGAARLSSGGSR